MSAIPTPTSLQFPARSDAVQSERRVNRSESTAFVFDFASCNTTQRAMAELARMQSHFKSEDVFEATEIAAIEKLSAMPASTIKGRPLPVRID